MNARRRTTRTVKKRTYATRKVPATVKRYVKRQIDYNIENKVSTAALTNIGVKRTGTINDLTNLARGTLPNQMIGDRVKAMSLKLRWEVEQSSSLILANDDHNNIRVIIFQWSPRREAEPPSLNQILNIPGSSDPTLAPYNQDYRSDYKIMYDKTYILSSHPVGVGSSVSYYMGEGSRALGRRVFYGKSLPRRMITYEGGLNTGRHHIYFLTVSDSAYDPDPLVSVTAEFIFQDA